MPTVGRRGTGILGSALDSAACYFPGLTTIADSGGTVVASLGSAGSPVPSSTWVAIGVSA